MPGLDGNTEDKFSNDASHSRSVMGQVFHVFSL